MSDCPECGVINFGINPRCVACVRKVMGERIALLEALVIQIHDKLEYGDVFNWDDGDECWGQMRAVKEQGE